MGEMEAAAMQIDDAQFPQGGERLQEAEKSLRKLAKRRKNCKMQV
jgi:hypothetical protein